MGYPGRRIKDGGCVMEVYYYVPADKVDDAVECGLKLSVWFDKEVMINGSLKKCISGLLNPKDDMEKYRSADLRCVKLEVSPEYCFVADKYLYLVGLNNPEIMELYHSSITPVEKYTFGTYRLPECLVTSTIVGGQVSLLGKMGPPILFDNSEELYINNIIEGYREIHDDFNDAVLYCFFSKLAENQKIDKIEDNKNKIALFIDRENGKVVTIKVPDMDKY